MEGGNCSEGWMAAVEGGGGWMAAVEGGWRGDGCGRGKVEGGWLRWREGGGWMAVVEGGWMSAVEGR